MSKYTDQMFILKQRLEPKIEKRVCVCECVKHIKQVMIMIIFQVHVFSYCFHTKKKCFLFHSKQKKNHIFAASFGNKLHTCWLFDG